jgi:hypothetical protein
MLKKLFFFSILISTSFYSFSQNRNWDSLGKEAAKTEYYSPVPPIVTPGNMPQDAPSDAIILFNGKDLSQWHAEDSTKPAGWKVADGIVTVDKKTGGIITKQRFLDFQMHLEWRIPTEITGSSQARGNSGVFLAYLGTSNGFLEDGYEVQILDCYENKTYVNGQTGSVYKQAVPLANACKKPGDWQYYDIIWKAPRFNADGSLKTPGYVTVLHNGVLLQNNTEIKGQTQWIGQPFYKAHGSSPIKLQAHGDPSPPISFRNIWLRPL